MYQQWTICKPLVFSCGTFKEEKINGETRFCYDYRKLNDVTHKDFYCLPLIDDLIEALSGAKWFTLWTSSPVLASQTHRLIAEFPDSVQALLKCTDISYTWIVEAEEVFLKAERSTH